MKLKKNLKLVNSKNEVLYEKYENLYTFKRRFVRLFDELRQIEDNVYMGVNFAQQRSESLYGY